MKIILIVFSIVAVVLLIYVGYEYVKQDPPNALTKLVTQTDPPPPLPLGEVAPLTVPEGFTATIFSRETPGARVLTRDQQGTMLASLTREGRIVALPDVDGNGEADEVRVVLQGLDGPHGILVHCGDTASALDSEGVNQGTCVLYVAEEGSVSSYQYDANNMTATERQELASLPTAGGGHFTRTLLMHPDGDKILVSVGSSCNVCEEDDENRAAVLSLDLQTNELTPFATGLRNTVFMAIDPVSGMVWGTDNGRDMIGDDIPPDEINIIEMGNNYGWPYCYGNNVYDTNFGRGNQNCDGMTASHIDLQAHSAALGLAFIPEEGWPEEMWNDVLIAYHGSWNRSVPTGYKVVRFDLAPTGERRSAQSGPIDFLTGFLEEGQATDAAIGRPVGILTEPGGVVYISDDRAGAIYRIARTSTE